VSALGCQSAALAAGAYTSRHVVLDAEEILSDSIDAPANNAQRRLLCVLCAMHTSLLALMPWDFRDHDLGELPNEFALKLSLVSLVLLDIPTLGIVLSELSCAASTGSAGGGQGQGQQGLGQGALQGAGGTQQPLLQGGASGGAQCAPQAWPTDEGTSLYALLSSLVATSVGLHRAYLLLCHRGWAPAAVLQRLRERVDDSGGVVKMLKGVVAGDSSSRVYSY
jgi:hypothetical protein